MHHILYIYTVQAELMMGLLFSIHLNRDDGKREEMLPVQMNFGQCQIQNKSNKDE